MQEREGLNRDVDGGVVTVKLFEKSKYIVPSKIVLEDKNLPKKNNNSSRN